ncbi:hypothetical protein SNEBB_006261 [Seison nebaliae]|nr:hypothetical protein SNEBB_006261 [Seison nebaliae]
MFLRIFILHMLFPYYLFQDTSGACKGQTAKNYQDRPCVYGECEIVRGGKNCHCLRGIKGKSCNEIQNPISPCGSNPCWGGEVCVPTASATSFVCLCPTGKTCRGKKPKKTACTSNPCKNGGTCYDVSYDGGYVCTCLNGYRGQRCDKKFDSCGAGQCKNSGKCYSTPLGAKCICRPSYYGERCEQRRGKKCLKNPCRNGGKCVEDRRESSGYSCVCPAGFGGNVCTQLSVQLCSPNPCLSGGTCYTYSGSFFCRCTPNRSGTTCEFDIVNPCHSRMEMCQNGATCIPNGGTKTGYRCVCRYGYVGDKCEMLGDSPCASNPCLNGGTCIAANLGYIGKYSCKCPKYAVGPRCQQSLASLICKKGTCLNGGTCQVDFDGKRRCICSGYYTGEECEIKVVKGLCSTAPCQNGGTCISNGGAAFCQCSYTTTGRYCETRDICSPLCDTNAFKNLDNIKCTTESLTNKKRCKCVSGYTGTYCERKDFCSSNPCQNKGICRRKDSPPYGECICESVGLAQPYCAFESCVVAPCVNGGICQDVVSGFRCLCPKGWKGLKCEKKDNSCFPSISSVSYRTSNSEIKRKNIDDLKVGEYVLTLDKERQLIETKFLGYLHEDHISVTDYLHLILENLTEIYISERHLLPMKTDGKFQYKFAKDIELNSILLDGNGHEQKLLSKQLLSTKGLFAPLTEYGTILVDDVLVSCYAHFPSHYIADLSITPYKIYKNFMNYINSTIAHLPLSSTINEVDSLLNAENYANTLLQLAQTTLPKMIFN